MMSIFPIIFNLNFKTNYNKIIYYFQKTPLIGSYIPDSLYKSTEVKKSLSLLAFILFILKNLFNKVLFFGFLAILSFSLPLFYENIPLSQPTIFVSLLLFTVFIGGTVSKTLFIETVNQQDLIAIKIFRIPPKAYYLAQFAFEYIQYFLFNSLVGGVFFYMSGISIWYAPLLFLSLVGIRLFLTALAIRFYTWGLNPVKEFWTWIMILLSVLSGAASVGILFLGYAVPISILTSVWFIAFVLVLSILGIYGWKTGDAINRIAYQSLSFETLETHLKVVETINAQGVTLDETDYKELRHKEELDSLTGIAYLNALFFERTRHHIKKHIQRRVILALIGVIALLVLYFFIGEAIPDSVNFLYIVSFITFAASNYLYYGEEFSKFCFYNLDRKLMKYRFYREPDIVMESIKFRFVKALKLNTPVMLIFLSGTVILFILSENIAFWALLLTLGFQVLLMVFFSLNYLILYYLLQPYTESMKTKSAIYSTINFVFLGLFLLIIYSDVNMLPLIIPALSLFIIVYLPIGLFAVYKKAPKQFKLRT